MVTVDVENAADAARKVKAGELPGPARTLAEALARIYADGGRYVQKTGHMTAGPARYSYAREGDFIAAVRPLMETHGVTISPSGMEVVTNETFERKNGGTAYRVVLLVTFRFLHTSGDSMTVTTVGEGQDSGDKAFNKAMTAAMKYALRQTFCVETGDDPDDEPSHQQERAAVKLSPPAAPVVNTTPDNLQRRAFWAMELGKVQDAGMLDAVCSGIGREVNHGKLSEADRLHLHKVLKEVQARVNGGGKA